MALNTRRTCIFGLGGLAFGLAGCAIQPAAPQQQQQAADLPPSAELTATPFFAQTAYQCGPAALATVLAARGKAVDPVVLAEQIFLPAREGTLQIEMLAGARRAGLVSVQIPGTLDSLLREVAAGNPVVVLQNLGLDLLPFWHYAVVVGYSLPGQHIVLRSGVMSRQVLSLSLFEQSWVRAGKWGFVVVPAGHWPASVQEAAVVDASIGFERVVPANLARRAYAGAVQRWPNNLALRMGLGNTAFAAGDSVLAADSFETAARQHRSAPAWINLAYTLLIADLPTSAWRAALEAEFLNDPGWRTETTAVLAEARQALLRHGR